MKKSSWIIAVIIAVLLLGSFPIRDFLGTTASDTMRIAGFVLLIFYSIKKSRSDKNSKDFNAD